MTKVHPTERELDLLKVLWRGPATVREVWQQLCDDQEDLAYTTVLSLLQIMEKKGLVEHESAGKAYRYRAKVRRNETVGDLAGRLLERVFDGAVDEYLVHALQSREVSLEELERLEAMIADAKKRSAKAAGPRGGKS